MVVRGDGRWSWGAYDKGCIVVRNMVQLAIQIMQGLWSSSQPRSSFSDHPHS